MVTDTRTALGSGRPGVRSAPPSRLRPFNEPQPLEVEPGEDDAPVAVFLSGYRCAVESLLECWRIDDEWWRERAVSRTYWRLLLENGCAIDIYQDGVSGRWYKQAYMG